MGKGVSRIEDGIPGEKSHAAVIAALVSVFCRDFRSSRSGMLKLRRIWIAIDFHGSDGAGWHVEFSALDTINNNCGSFAASRSGVGKCLDETQEEVHCQRG